MDWVFLHLGPLAQSVEQQTFNLWVVGSIPTGPTIILIPPLIHPYQWLLVYNINTTVENMSGMVIGEYTMSDLS